MFCPLVDQHVLFCGFTEAKAWFVAWKALSPWRGTHFAANGCCCIARPLHSTSMLTPASEHFLNSKLQSALHKAYEKARGCPPNNLQHARPTCATVLTSGRFFLVFLFNYTGPIADYRIGSVVIEDLLSALFRSSRKASDFRILDAGK